MLPRILSMRGRGMSYTEIARDLGLKWHQVRDTIKRWAPDAKATTCGVPTGRRKASTIGTLAYRLVSEGASWQQVAAGLERHTTDAPRHLYSQAYKDCHLRRGWPWPPRRTAQTFPVRLI